MEKPCPLGLDFRCSDRDRAEADPSANIRASSSSFDPTSVRTLPKKLTRLLGTVAALGLMVVARTSPGHAQVPPPLGTTADFAILAGTGITNTGPSVISGIPAHPGDIGSSTASITGFPPESWSLQA
jgi:hypothetical protein